VSAGEIDLGAEMAREPRPRVAKRVAVRHDVRVRLASETPAESIARDLEDTVRRITRAFGGG
jgi:hypothetical protein